MKFIINNIYLNQIYYFDIFLSYIYIKSYFYLIYNNIINKKNLIKKFCIIFKLEKKKMKYTLYYKNLLI